MLRLVRVFIISLFCTMFWVGVTGCVDRFPGEETGFSTGCVLTPEMIESIFDEISLEETEKYPIDTLDNGEIQAYWLTGGSVWHISMNCGSIANALPDNIKSGRIEDAISEGKTRGCKICTDGFVYYAESEVTTDEVDSYSTETTGVKYPKTYDADGNLIVYWVKNGGVWHVSRYCSSLSKSSDADILCGTESDALSNGKERACKICSADK